MNLHPQNGKSGVPLLGQQEIKLATTKEGWTMAVVVALNRPVMEGIKAAVREAIREELALALHPEGQADAGQTS